MTQESIDVAAVLQRLSLFSQLAPEHIAQLVAATRERHLHRGELLFQRGDVPRGFHCVVSGQIKLGVSSAHGQEKVVELIGPGQSFGEAVMFLERNYPVFAEAVSDTLVLHIARSAVFELLEHDASFSRHMLAGLSIRLHGLIQDVESYSLRSSLQRVIGYLLQAAETAPPDADGKCTIELSSTKQLIASRLNLTPETLSRALGELSAAGLIVVHGRHITLHQLARLAAYEG
ncbi:MAG: Crp/Fnr family transcriptional regulator [Zoogloea sp.]|nr:Crp/Fnr family transcriptional regulator [Zoogloea sp.]